MEQCAHILNDDGFSKLSAIRKKEPITLMCTSNVS